VSEAKSKESQQEKVHCNTCGGIRTHQVIATRHQEDTSLFEEEFEVGWYITYTLLECAGCHTVSLRRRRVFSEWNQGDEEITFFPPQVSRRQPSWLEQVDEEIQEIVREVYTALHADSRRLALMGARAVLDVIMVRKVGDIGSFTAKLDALEKAGITSPRQTNLLQAALDAGNAAAHRGHLPTAEELGAIMDIVENLLHLDLLDPAADELRRSTPSRVKRAGPKPSTGP
jgi:uncharacterized protein DUF4145